jgi:putative zinc finger/helix-turn-helix YgiT family protein
MKCTNCGSPTVAKLENYQYKESGLSNVILAGVTVHACPDCGEFEVELPDVEGLHKSIAQKVATQPRRLESEEVKFLRKYLGWSGREAARKLGVTHNCISRFENAHKKVPWQIEQILRLQALYAEPVKDYDPRELTADMPAAHKPLEPITIMRASTTWRMTAPVASCA